MSAGTIQALGLSLIHFLWQGALVALALEVTLFALRDRSARLRYALRCAALGLMGLLPVATFVWLRYGGSGTPALPVRPEDLLAAVQPAEASGTGPMGWLVATWGVGTLFCAARLARDYRRIRRLQSKGAGSPLPEEWQVRFDRLATRMQARATVRVIDSVALAAPTVIGWLRPVVLVPARALTGLTTEQLEAVLAHELAHIRRHDYLVNLVQSALEALLFYHPAVWWVSNGIRAEREFCCDDAALSLSSDGVVYARALATLEGWRGVQPEFGLSTLGGPLMTRIQRLIGVRPSSRPVHAPMIFLSTLLVLGCTTAFAHHTPSDGQDPEQMEALRAHVEEMQLRLDELRAMLDEASNRQAIQGEGDILFYDANDSEGGEQNEWVTEVHEPHGDVRVLVQGDGDDPQVFEWTSDDGERNEWTSEGNEFIHEGDGVFVVRGAEGEHLVEVLVETEDGEGQGHAVIRIEGGGDGDYKVLKSKIKDLKLKKEAGAKAKVIQKLKHRLHGSEGDSHLDKLHEHLSELHEDEAHLDKLHARLRRLHEGDSDAKGEATIEVIIKSGDGPARRIHKRIPLNGSVELHGMEDLHDMHGSFEMFFGGEGDSGDVRIFELDRNNNRWFGSKDGAHFEFRSDDDDDGHDFWFSTTKKDQRDRALTLRMRAEDERDRADADADRKDRVFTLKKRAEDDRQRADSYRERVIELKNLLELKHSNVLKLDRLPPVLLKLPAMELRLPGAAPSPKLPVRLRTECEEDEGSSEKKVKTKQAEIV